MAQPTIWDNIRDWIGGIAWAIFLWSARMTQEEYFDLLEREIQQRNEAVGTVGESVPLSQHSTSESEACPYYTHNFYLAWHGNYKYCPICGMRLHWSGSDE